MKRKTKTIITVSFLLLMAILVVDFAAYSRHRDWYIETQRSLYKGMPVSDLRAYLEDGGEKHGIRHLREFNQDGRHWFIFMNPNYSIITTLITSGIDELLQGGVAVWLDERDRVDHVNTFE